MTNGLLDNGEVLDSDRSAFNYRIAWVLALAAWALMTVPALWVMPGMDDWTASTPILAYSSDLLMPSRTLWRPFQHLFRVVAAYFPYPAFAHITNAIGHLLAMRLVYLLSRRCGGTKTSAIHATIVYAIAPAVGATVWSIDSENHVWSNTCGLASAWALLAGSRTKWQGIALWVVLSFASVLWNEGGIVWFVLGPCLGVFAVANNDPGTSEDARRVSKTVYAHCGRCLIIGLLGVVLYFVARFSLLGEIALGVRGQRYGIGLDPIKWAANASLLLGMALTTADTLALLSSKPQYLLGLVTLLLGIPYVYRLFQVALKRWSLPLCLLVMVSLIAVVSPFAVMGHVSEMYAPRPAALFAILLIGSVTTTRMVSQGRLRWFAGLALLGAMIGNAHKLDSMIRTGQRSLVVGAEIGTLFGTHIPRQICAICQSSKDRIGYSVFEAPADAASHCGMSVRMEWGWKREVVYEFAQSVDECSVGADAIIEVARNGRVRRFR